MPSFNIGRNQEWLDRASDSRYPLISGVTAKDESESFELPNDFLVSLYLAVPADLLISPVSVYISQVIAATHYVRLQFSASVDGDDTAIASVDVIYSAAQTGILQKGYAQFALEGIGSYADLRGQIQVASIDSIKLQPVGSFTFAYANSAIEPDAVRPQLRQLMAAEVEIGADQFARLTGVLRLRSGANTRWRVVTENGEPVAYIDALDASDLNEQLACDEGGALKPIRRIGGIPGDAQGNFQLTGSRCLTISPANFGVGVRNECSEPCAGCTEVEPLAGRVKAMESQLPTLTNFIANLTAQVQRMVIATDMSTAVTECQTLGGDVAP